MREITKEDVKMWKLGDRFDIELMLVLAELDSPHRKIWTVIWNDGATFDYTMKQLNKRYELFDDIAGIIHKPSGVSMSR